MQHFEGLWVPIVTPFRDGALDLDAAQALARHLCENGVDGLIVAGTTGEPATLSEDEQQRLLAVVIEAVGDACPVVFGISGNDTRAVAAQARAYERSGCAGLLVSAPYYVRPAQEGIRRHFEQVAAATALPILLYNIPYRTGVNIELDTVRRLAENPQFAAIKESGGGNVAQLGALIDETPLKVLSGEDSMIFVCACLGGHGAISAAAHLRPDLYAAMLRAVRNNELAAARAIARRLQPVIQALFSEPNPAPLKAALAMLGLVRDELRLPLTPASAACKARLAPLVENLFATP